MSISGIEFSRVTGVGGGADSFRSKLAETDQSSNESYGSEGAGGSKTFGELLSNLSRDANVAQIDADKMIQNVAVGKSKDLHSAMIAMEKADMQFRLLTQVRNKVIDAYREIMRMQA